MAYKLLILTLFIFTVISAHSQITVSGYVTDSENGEPLIGASIYDQTGGQGTTSNLYGFYSYTTKNEEINLRVSYVGYVAKTATITENKSLNFDLIADNELDEFNVVASETGSLQDETQMSSNDVSMEKVKSLPVLLGESDVLKTIQLLPGVQSGSEGASGIYVRGGGPDQNLILLDGVPVYNATHLFGFFSVFNADAINNVRLIKGGFPAHYGGRLSSVIDIRMKEGNMKEIHAEGSVGIISAKLLVEGPIVKDKTSFAISGRRTYLDALARPFVADGDADAGYFFYDLNAKINHKFNDKHRLFGSAYLGKDVFYLRTEDSYLSGGNTYDESLESGLDWGNRILALRWNYLITPKLFSNTTVTYSNYNFNTGAALESVVTGAGVYSTESYEFNYLSGIEDYGVKMDFDYTPHPNHYIKFGTGYTYHTFTPGVNQILFQDNLNTIDTSFGSPVVYANEFWAYAEDDFKVNNFLKVNAGLHFAGFNVDGITYASLQPRVAARALLDETSSIKVSYSRMAQFLHLLSNTGIGLPTDLWVPPTANIKPQLSNQFALGYAQTLTKKFEITAEAYYKTMENIIEYKDGATFFGNDESWEEKVEIGRGWSYGFELLLEKKIGKTSGWVGYTLSWTNRQFDNLNFGEPFPFRYDRRHDIGAALTHKFNESVDIGVVYVYGTGNAVTLGTERFLSINQAVDAYQTGIIADGVEYVDSRNNYRMPSYHRLDVGVNLRKRKNWGERTFSIGVYNVYGRENPFLLYFSNDDDGNRRLTQLSLFRFVPSISYSFKF